MNVDAPVQWASELFRAVTPGRARRAVQPLVNRVLLAAALRAQRPTGVGHGRVRPLTPGPLIVSGFFSEALGVGRAGRLSLTALEQAGLAPLAHDIRATIAAKPRAGPALAPRPGGVWLSHCNPPELLSLLFRIPARQWRDRYRIGYWVYETTQAPDLWRKAAHLVDEVWTPSRFAADALAGSPTPVRVVPHPVALEGPPAGELTCTEPANRPDPARFTVFCTGDMRSSRTRKNLEGAIAAYRQAFTPEDGAELIVKTLHLDSDPTGRAQLVEAIGARRDVRLMTEPLSSAAMAALIAASDVVFSPHRAEGFGLVLAEALLLGTPVVATGWSGNLEFMEALPGLLIRHALIPVHDHASVYAGDRGARWAEPDLSDAAAKLRWVRANPAAARALATRGGEAVRALSASWGPRALQALPMAPWLETMATLRAEAV